MRTLGCTGGMELTFVFRITGVPSVALGGAVKVVRVSKTTPRSEDLVLGTKLASPEYLAVIW